MSTSLPRSAPNSGSLSENTNVAVSVGVNPRVARVRDRSVSCSRTPSHAGPETSVAAVSAARAAASAFRKRSLSTRISVSLMRSVRTPGAADLRLDPRVQQFRPLFPQHRFDH